MEEIDVRLLRRMTKMLRRHVLFLAGSIILPGLSLAWDGTVSGVLGMIDVTDGASAGFRIYLPVAMCGNANNWAYLNNTDSNYGAYTAALLMAKAQGLTVYVYSNRDSNGYCHIGYIQVL
jgi:hypothetical protein